MNISELDEAQGLNRELVRDFLRKRGFRYEDKFWIGPSLLPLSYPDTDSYPLHCESSLRSLLVNGGFASAQDMLRQVNPRLQTGIPSEAARRAHNRNCGVWIAAAGDLGNGGSILFVSFPDPGGIAVWTVDEWELYADEDEMGAKCRYWGFWPVDQHGNKVRWPIGLAGML